MNFRPALTKLVVSISTTAVLLLMYGIATQAQSDASADVTLFFAVEVNDQAMLTMQIVQWQEQQPEPTVLQYTFRDALFAFSNMQREALYAVPGTIIESELARPNQITQAYPVNMYPLETNVFQVQMGWLPDDSRLIYKIDDTARNSYDIGAWNRHNEEFYRRESWPWTECQQIARHIQTQRLALICQVAADVSSENIDYNIAAVFWGEEPIPYTPEQFTLLLDSDVSLLTGNIEWRHDQGQDTVYFIGEPEQSIQGPGLYQITGTQVISLALQSPGQTFVTFSAAPDQSTVAWIVQEQVGSSQRRDCIRLVGEMSSRLPAEGLCTPVVAAAQDTPRFSQVNWYPDSDQLLIVCHSPDLLAYIRRFNLLTGEDVILRSGYAEVRDAVAIHLGE